MDWEERRLPATPRLAMLLWGGWVEINGRRVVWSFVWILAVTALLGSFCVGHPPPGGCSMRCLHGAVTTSRLRWCVYAGEVVSPFCGIWPTTVCVGRAPPYVLGMRRRMSARRNVCAAPSAAVCVADQMGVCLGESSGGSTPCIFVICL